MAIVLACLPVFFSSCEKELNGGGEKVPVRFAVSAGDYEESEGAVRSFGSEAPETKVVPIGDDLYLYATLKPDPDATSDELRAGIALADGQKVYLAAYEQGTSTPAAPTTLYTCTGGQMIADGGNPLGVEPGTYDFVAYSYYNSSETPAASNINPVKDLVWGSQAGRPIAATYEGRTVTIKMDHLFSKVKVNLKVSEIANASITELDEVEIEGNSTANLSVYNGVISKNAALTQELTFPDSYPTTNTTSAALLVYPVVSPSKARVNIGHMKIAVSGETGSPYTISDLLVEFDSPLAAGKSYLLEVSLNRTRWAYSNIYWKWNNDGDHTQGGRLTFDVHDEDHEGYQGVGFKYGSLVGISLAQPSAGDNTFSSAVPVYLPDYDQDYPTTGSSWTKSTSHPYTAGGWPASTLGTTEDAAINIPYLDGRAAFVSTDNTRTNMYAMHADRNTDEMYEALRGDICQYLGKTQAALKGYRLPTSREWGTVGYTKGSGWGNPTPNVDGWVKGPGTWTTGVDNAVGNEEGIVDLMYKGYITNVMMGVTLTIGGGRSNNGGGLRDVANIALYLTGSAYSNTGGCYLVTFRDDNVWPIGFDNRSIAHTVRCIKKLPTE
jgi:hypothetical protein